MKYLPLLIIIGVSTLLTSAKDMVVSAKSQEDCTEIMRQAIEEVSRSGGGTISMQHGIYKFDRDNVIQRLYHVSNTTSESEDADPTKHIALLLRYAKNITIDGNGSTLMLDGELTSFVIDSCENITLKNLTIDNAHPTQTEMTLLAQDGNSALMSVHPTSQYRIEEGGRLVWYGKGWEFSGGIAQTFDPTTDETWRSWSPMDGLKQAVEVCPGKLWLNYDKLPDQKVGWTYQMRDAIRDEVCGLIANSSNVTFENVNIHFAGNFGVVSQCTRNITMDKVRFEPAPGSGRTNVGFADFLQFSSCGGTLKIRDCRFTGAHDDPINVHGTYLKVVKRIDDRHIQVRYMHPQTYGFQQFFPGNAIEFASQASLLPIATAKVKSAIMIDERTIEITTDKPLDSAIIPEDNVAVENVSYTPDVEVSNCYFSRIPTRGILVSTRGKVMIEHNTFLHMHMSSILIADDANSWYESGPVKDVTIRYNKFIGCGAPVINILPETKKYEGPVHRGIKIYGNDFTMSGIPALTARGVDGIDIADNIFDGSYTPPAQSIDIKDCENVRTISD